MESVAVTQATSYVDQLKEEEGNIRWSVNHAIDKAIERLAKQQAELIAKRVTVSIGLE